MSQVTSQKVRSVASITKEIQSLDPKNQALVIDVLKKLLLVGGDNIKNTLLTKLLKSPIMRKKE